jgi:hypothetical protein
MLNPIDPTSFWQEDAIIGNLELLRVRETKTVPVAPLTKLWIARTTAEEVFERLIQIDNRLLERVVRNLLEPRRFGFECRQFFNLVIGGKPTRIATVPSRPPGEDRRL